MGRPLILFGLGPIANASFETDAAGIDPPTGWGDASVNGINAVDAVEYQSAGTGLPSAKSLKQNVDDGTAGNKAVLIQRPEMAGLIAALLEADAELAVLASIKPESQIGLDNAFLRIRPYDATGTSTPGSGNELTLTSERRFRAAGPIWFLEVSAGKLPAGTTWVDVEVAYDIARASYSATASVWWDRVMVGGLVDLDRGFQGRITAELETGVRANEGDGVFEMVRTSSPATEIEAELRNILHLTDDDAAMDAFAAWLGADVGKVAFWRSRDELTNRGRHFQACYHNADLRVRTPEGILRDDYRLRFRAPAEGLG